MHIPIADAAAAVENLSNTPHIRLLSLRRYNQLVNGR
jgi:hypothetical protein